MVMPITARTSIVKSLPSGAGLVTRASASYA